tara:strand:- start:82 stop:408 length:327 start_codon:yes stop_codon:yes gene_type:complete
MADILLNHFASVSNGAETALTIAGSFDVTILSFTICNNHATTDTTVDVYIKDSSNSDKFYYLYKTLSLPAKSTFEHTDKIVLDDNDDLYYDPVASIQIEAVCSYLKQT